MFDPPFLFSIRSLAARFFPPPLCAHVENTSVEPVPLNSVKNKDKRDWIMSSQSLEWLEGWVLSVISSFQDECVTLWLTTDCSKNTSPESYLQAKDLRSVRYVWCKLAGARTYLPIKQGLPPELYITTQPQPSTSIDLDPSKRFHSSLNPTCLQKQQKQHRTTMPSLFGSAEAIEFLKLYPDHVSLPSHSIPSLPYPLSPPPS